LQNDNGEIRIDPLYVGARCIYILDGRLMVAIDVDVDVDVDVAVDVAVAVLIWNEQ
jgi:hypothetical protein